MPKMIERVRVRSGDVEYSVVKSALHLYEGVEVLDKPANDATGNPLPSKRRKPLGKSSPTQSFISQTGSPDSSAKGRKASTTTEEIS